MVCIACVKSKRPHRSRTGDMYTSPLFRLSLRYGRTLNPEQILVLSAKYGVLGLSDEIEPYEQTLNRMPKLERSAWAERALGQLRDRADLENDRFVFLAGQRYRENLVTRVRHWEVPMEGLAFGEQLQWLKDRLER